MELDVYVEPQSYFLDSFAERYCGSLLFKDNVLTYSQCLTPSTFKRGTNVSVAYRTYP
jgi:hypothetical protein